MFQIQEKKVHNEKLMELNMGKSHLVNRPCGWSLNPVSNVVNDVN